MFAETLSAPGAKNKVIVRTGHVRWRFGSLTAILVAAPRLYACPRTCWRLEVDLLGSSEFV